MPIETERAAFHLVHERWAAGDLDAVMQLFHDDVLHLINVDGVAVPYAASSYGKEDLRLRLQLVIDAFFIDKFEIESYAHMPEFSRSVVVTHKTHKKTGERLCERLHFRYWFKGGLIMRVEERHDAAYIEAFQRLVVHAEHGTQRFSPPASS